MAASTSDSFLDFDEPAVFQKFKDQAKSHQTRNFVIDFTEEKAVCAFDLSAEGINRILHEGAEAGEAGIGRNHAGQRSATTRWINIWRPEKQKDVIKSIANHYGMSPRLALSMCCDPLRPEPAKEPLSRSDRVRQALHHRSWQAYGRATSKLSEKLDSDVESRETEEEGNRRSLDLNHYRIVNEIWHFFSVDWGHRYTSIGYNQLYETKAHIDTDDSDLRLAKPEGRRIWAWILLCDDGTVISINENPFPQANSLDRQQQHELESIRHNLLNIFDQLSKATDQDHPLNPIMTVQVRAGRKSSMAESHVRDEDSPSLLLYYLFDDWYTSYSLVAKSDHEYKRQLDSIRQDMFRSPQLSHVHKLHALGSQLSVLKRMYEGYTLIIDRIINRPKPIFTGPARLDNSGNAEQDEHGERLSMLEGERIQAEGYGAPISSAAALRFERLRDRISLYALSEIRSCLDEKDSLMSMNFNLIAIKEESYVERLTRITILLAKVTILFIPVSFLATYFGINFIDSTFTVEQFWIAFAVIFLLSFAILLIFGYISDTQESGPIYQSLTRTAVIAWRAFTGQPQVKKKRP